jgi:hypothetical protein
MPMENQERALVLGLAEVERLQSAGVSALERGRDANEFADALLTLSQTTSHHRVSQMAMLAHAGIASGQIKTAAAALASVSDQIATATNTFAMAARIANEGEAHLTFPFVAGKAASLLDLLKSLQKTVADTQDDVQSAGSIAQLLGAFETAKTSLTAVKEQAERFVA